MSASDDYKATLRSLSDRIVEAQKPIRILDAIKWDASVQEAFFAGGERDEPPVDREYYERRPLEFDPRAKRKEFEQIAEDVTRLLGRVSPVGRILRRTCEEYRTVVKMLDSRGTPAFARLSQSLYGSATEAFHAGDPSLADLGAMMSDSLASLERSPLLTDDPRDISAERAVEILQERLTRVFAATDMPVNVLLSDGIVADAAAGSDYIKIRKDAMFNDRDLRLLEIHEGWVHLGTTLNGKSQPVCTFLAKGPPSSTVTQEGLAILMELLTFTSNPTRLKRVTQRIQAIHMAEEGATFRAIYNYFREQGANRVDAFANAARVFRGSTPTEGPFTKDLSYSKGFVLAYNLLLLAVRKGKVDRIPLLFCGKTNLEDVGTLAVLLEEGILAPPRFLPEPIRDLRALTAWMCYSAFISRLNLERIEIDYAPLL